jgi:hypothetical protein
MVASRPGSSPASSGIASGAPARAYLVQTKIWIVAPSRSSAGKTLAALRKASSNVAWICQKRDRAPTWRSSRSGGIESRCDQVVETAW